MSLARKYKREDILQEKKLKRMHELYFEHTREERDLNRHLYYGILKNLRKFGGFWKID